MALVPVDDAAERKRNRELLKMQAKAMTSTTEDGKDPKKAGKVIFDADANEDDGTFVTGLGIPGKSKKGKATFKHDPNEKFYAKVEDELLDRVEKTEKDMHDMMKYLN